MDNILEFNEATEAEQEVAKKAAEKIGDNIYFSYNLPLQITVPEQSEIDEAKRYGEEIPCGQILNYMPRKERCEFMDLSDLGFNGVTDRENMREFCDTTISILKNLIRKWELFRDGKIDMIYYPNSENN